MINLPLGILILAGLILLVPESKSPQRAGGIDWIGAAISVVMFSTLVFGLIEGRIYGWWGQTANQFSLGSFTWPADTISVIPVALAISLISGLLFVFWERRQEKAQKTSSWILACSRSLLSETAPSLRRLFQWVSLESSLPFRFGCKTCLGYLR